MGSTEALAGRAEWFLDSVRASDQLSDEDIDEQCVTTSERDPEWHREALRWWLKNLDGGFAIDGDATTVDGELLLPVVGENGRRWVARFGVEPAAPWRLASFRLDRRLPEGVEVREAVASDGPAIAALYRSTPMQAGETRVIIDPGDDYFATTRLMEESHTLVATEHGGIIGVYCGTLYAGRLHDRDVTITLGCHSRMAEGKAGGGVWSNMNRALLDRFAGRFDVPLAFVLSGNAAAARLTAAGAWPAHPVRAVVVCDPAAPASGRSATAADAGEIVEIVNHTNRGQDLYRPYSVESLSARLERAPDLYGWADLRLDGGAVVGVGRVLEGRVSEGPAGRHASTRAKVFDHGFLPGCERTYRALLGDQGARAASRGASHLSVFTTEGSPTHGPLTALAELVEVYDVLVPGQTAADDSAERGIYVDQAHF